MHTNRRTQLSAVQGPKWLCFLSLLKKFFTGVPYVSPALFQLHVKVLLLTRALYAESLMTSTRVLVPLGDWFEQVILYL